MLSDEILEICIHAHMLGFDCASAPMADGGPAGTMGPNGPTGRIVIDPFLVRFLVHDAVALSRARNAGWQADSGLNDRHRSAKRDLFRDLMVHELLMVEHQFGEWLRWRGYPMFFDAPATRAVTVNHTIMDLSSTAPAPNLLQRMYGYSLLCYPRNRTTLFDPATAFNMEWQVDETCDREYNRHLSLARARAVGEALGTGTISVEGAGGTSSIYPNDSPAGRFYSRSVRVVVDAGPTL